MKTKTAIEPSYWNKKGNHQMLYDSLVKQFVPDKGDCENKFAEPLRLISNLYYEIYNNRLCNDFSSQVQSLINLGGEFKIAYKDPAYFDAFIDFCIDYVESARGEKEFDYSPKDENCSSCNGKGEYPDIWNTDEDGFEDEPVICDDCAGSGIQQVFEDYDGFDWLKDFFKQKENIEMLEATVDAIVLYVDLTCKKLKFQYNDSKDEY